MASAPPRTRAALVASSAVSLLAHAVVLVLAFSITTDATRGTPRPPGIEWTLPPDPTPPVELPPPPSVGRDPVEGGTGPRPDFGTLPPPTIDPTTIPVPTVGPPTDEGWYIGRGVTAGGEARPAAGGDQPPPDPADNPGAFVPMSVAPDLLNRAAVQRALQRLYPPMLRDAGFGGQVVVWVYVDESGSVIKAVVRKSSGHTELDAVALEVVKVMRFSPAMNRDQRVKVWVSVPVTFRAGD